MKTFTTTLNGFNKKEVNDFVSEVIIEYERLLDKLKSKDIEISILNERLNNYKNIEHGLNEEARYIIEDAKKNASRIVNDSLISAAKTNAEVDELKRKIDNYRSHLRQNIDEQLVILDDIDKIDF